MKFKKILILIFLLTFIMGFSYSAYALEYIPQTIVDYANEYSVGKNYCISYQDPQTYRVIVSFEKNTLVYTQGGIQGNYSGSGGLKWSITNDGGLTWTEEGSGYYKRVGILTGGMIYSTVNITSENTLDVFFSQAAALPLEVKPILQALNQFMTDFSVVLLRVLTPGVIIFSLLLAISLIPSLIYRYL